MKKSNYRVVPMQHEKFGACWAIKQGKLLVGTFISKLKADQKKMALDAMEQEDFLLGKTKNQELKIEL